MEYKLDGYNQEQAEFVKKLLSEEVVSDTKGDIYTSFTNLLFFVLGFLHRNL